MGLGAFRILADWKDDKERFSYRLGDGTTITIDAMEANRLKIAITDWQGKDEAAKHAEHVAARERQKVAYDSRALALLARLEEIIPTRRENSATSRRRAAIRQLADENGLMVGEVDGYLHVARVIEDTGRADQVRKLIAAGTKRKDIGATLHMSQPTIAAIAGPFKKTREQAERAIIELAEQQPDLTRDKIARTLHVARALVTETLGRLPGKGNPNWRA